MTVSEVLREANKIADKRLEIFHQAMKSLQDDQRRIGNMKVSMNRKYRTSDYQKVRLLCTDRKAEYPVVALIGEREDVVSFTSTGSNRADGKHPYDLVEVSEWEDFKISESVMVRDGASGAWVRRFFSGVTKDGKPMVWARGAVAWSAEGNEIWDECRRPTTEELGG